MCAVLLVTEAIGAEKEKEKEKEKGGEVVGGKDP
jgi:hypothetical protein